MGRIVVACREPKPGGRDVPEAAAPFSEFIPVEADP